MACSDVSTLDNCWSWVLAFLYCSDVDVLD
jgi:hypothetical protein